MAHIYKKNKVVLQWGEISDLLGKGPTSTPILVLLKIKCFGFSETQVRVGEKENLAKRRSEGHRTVEAWSAGLSEISRQ